MPFTKGMTSWNKGMSRPDLLPTAKPTMMDIAWAAGVYEGEGTCQTQPYQRGSARQTFVRVSQKDSWLCHRLRTLFGGSCKTYTQKAGSLNDPELRREYWRWDIYGSRALGFLQTIYAFQSPRRQGQIKAVIDAVRKQGD